MLSLDLETDTTAEDTAPSSPDGGAETPATLDVLEEVWRGDTGHSRCAGRGMR